MSYTGILEKDATKEEIRAAKKTVQIITEINGHKYVEEYDCTDGIVVLAVKGEEGKGKIELPAGALFEYIDRLMADLPTRMLVALLAKGAMKLEYRS